MKTRPLVGLIVLAAVFASGAYAVDAGEHEGEGKKVQRAVKHNNGSVNGVQTSVQNAPAGTVPGSSTPPPAMTGERPVLLAPKALTVAPPPAAAVLTTAQPATLSTTPAPTLLAPKVLTVAPLPVTTLVAPTVAPAPLIAPPPPVSTLVVPTTTTTTLTAPPPVIAPITAPPPVAVLPPPIFVPPPVVLAPPPVITAPVITTFVPVLPPLQTFTTLQTTNTVSTTTTVKTLCSTTTSTTCSDRRLKMNIHRIGTHRLGIGIYEYDYVWGTHAIGVMADEVKTVMPSAVIRGADGYDRVDYSKLN